jgi:hypothetical protein
LTAAVALLGVPAVAAAGIASSEGGTARFSDPSGANDDLSVTLERIDRTPDVDPQGWNVLFYSLADPVTWGAGCQEGFVGTICPYGPNPPAALAVDLGDGDDQLELDVKVEAADAPTRISVSAGAGDDLVATVRARADIDGGPGDDVIKPDERRALDLPPDPTPGGVIRGGAGRDQLDGRGGNDTIDALDGAPGDRIACADGADVALADAGDIVAVEQTTGGAACERVTWAPRLVSSRLRYRDGRIALALSCPRAASTCRGSVLLRSAGSRPRTLARTRYRAKSGKRASLRLKTTRAGRSAFKRRSVKATALVQPRGATTATGPVVTVRR